MDAKVTTGIILDTRRKKEDGTYPVKLRLTQKGKRKYFSIDSKTRSYSFTKREFEAIMKPDSRGKNKDYRLTFNDIEKTAAKIIENMPVFTFDGFKRAFQDKENKDVFSYFDDYINSLEEKDRYNYASIYKTTLKSLKGFYKNKQLLFDDLTVNFLKKYESYLKAKNKTVTTIAIHMRNIRRIYNLAIKKGYVKPELYPFGDENSNLYQIKEERRRKKGLPINEITKIYNYKPLEGTPEHFYKDIWLFQYLCNGINLTDVFRLKYKNVTDEGITFNRKKSSRKNNLKEIYAPLLPETKDIINRWGTKPILSSNYVFNLLNDNMSENDKVKKIRDKSSNIRKGIKKIKTKAGVKYHINNQTARHSFANNLRNENVPLALIQDSMGHSSISTTEIYCSDFDVDKRIKAANKLRIWNNTDDNDIDSYKKIFLEAFGTDNIKEIKKKINKTNE